MNRFLTAALALYFVCCLSVSAYAFTNPFAQNSSITISTSHEHSLNLRAGEILEFQADDLERRLGMEAGQLGGVTVTALPTSQEGQLILYGIEVEHYQFISREELDELCFVPNETAVAANLTIQPQGMDHSQTRLTISVLENDNSPPVIESGSYSTIKNTSLTGTISAYDPDGDSFVIYVTRAPKKGSVAFTGQQFVYKPFLNATGSDSFVIAAVDRFGNFSSDITMEIKIENNRSNFKFVDMSGNASEYAAFKLHESEVLSGEKIGFSWFFHPKRQMTRGDFLIAVLSATDLDQNLSPSVNTQLPGDAQLPLWIKPYLKQAVEQDIWPSHQAFAPDQIPTRAEAVQMVALAAKIEDVKDFSLQAGDLSDIPTWALPYYKDLAAYRMLDLHDGMAHPNAPLDNAYAADLLWQLYKHIHR